MSASSLLGVSLPRLDPPQCAFFEHICRIVHKCRNIKLESGDAPVPINRVLGFASLLRQISSALNSTGHGKEADIFQIVLDKALSTKNQGGLGLQDDASVSLEDEVEILFLLEAWLESLNSQDKCARPLRIPQDRKAPLARAMTLTEKIFAHHSLAGTPNEGLKAGDVLMVDIDWVITSEAGWFAMSKIFTEMGETQIWRNDRFWIAGDHVVDPRNMHEPQVKALVQASEQAKVDFRLTEYQGMNYTIMHTEFVRERAQPGMIVVGADSHTCSSGAMGCLAIGLGAADVVMPLATGQTWFKVPESILINFVGRPSFGISGKDVILHVLGELKRNTVASGKVVEFAGPGARSLSIDARFAIANMCTEFGAITGVFVPDEITHAYISRRKTKKYRTDSVYFRPDDGALYSDAYTIDLSQVQPTIALYPSPDNVVTISERSGMRFDGVFIGACTTTEEDLILGALILKAGLACGKRPVKKGIRHVVPGSLPITENLKKIGLLDIYEEAGFTVGVPGCSYCVGMGADKAGKGEVWLSSQNRNFQNRMGPGSFGSITSAVVAAASSFSMTLTDPRPLLEHIEETAFDLYARRQKHVELPEVKYVEPVLGSSEGESMNYRLQSEAPPDLASITEASQSDVIRSKAITLGDFVDTDALAPAEYLMAAKDNEELADHCMEHTYPEFRSMVRAGQQVVVGGKAFGCGSSREQAASALKGLGVRAVIARSFSFIYGRNQPSLGLLGIELNDDRFYQVATNGVEIEIDIPKRLIKVAQESFDFQLAEMEYRLTMNKGLQASYKKFGRDIWRRLAADGLNKDVVAGPREQSAIAFASSGLVEHEGSSLDW